MPADTNAQRPPDRSRPLRSRPRRADQTFRPRSFFTRSGSAAVLYGGYLQRPLWKNDCLKRDGKHSSPAHPPALQSQRNRHHRPAIRTGLSCRPQVTAQTHSHHVLPSAGYSSDPFSPCPAIVEPGVIVLKSNYIYKSDITFQFCNWNHFHSQRSVFNL